LKNLFIVLEPKSLAYDTQRTDSRNWMCQYRGTTYKWNYEWSSL